MSLCQAHWKETRQTRGRAGEHSSNHIWSFGSWSTCLGYSALSSCGFTWAKTSWELKSKWMTTCMTLTTKVLYLCCDSLQPNLCRVFDPSLQFTEGLKERTGPPLFTARSQKSSQLDVESFLFETSHVTWWAQKSGQPGVLISSCRG